MVYSTQSTGMTLDFRFLTSSMWLLIFQRMIIEFALDVLYFPLWWYTDGLKRVAIGCWHLVQDGNAHFSPGLWLKNIFVPMFGQYDWQGRLMSFFMRLANVIGRSICLVIWVIVVCLFFLAWIVFPLFVTYMLVQSLIR